MGRGIELVCKRCHYSFGVNFGVGFMFPLAYQETIEAAKEGKLGIDVKAFLCEHPDGALDCDQVLLLCTTCGKLDRDIDLSMYIPVGKPVVHEHKWSVPSPQEDISYVTPWKLKKLYMLVKPYEHICKKCGSRMRVIKEDDLLEEDQVSEEKDVTVNVNCPKCCLPMTVGGYLMWD